MHCPDYLSKYHGRDFTVPKTSDLAQEPKTSCARLVPGAAASGEGCGGADGSGGFMGSAIPLIRKKETRTSVIT